VEGTNAAVLSSSVLRNVSFELRNVSLELRNVSLELRNVSLELRNVSLELRNVSSRVRTAVEPGICPPATTAHRSCAHRRSIKAVRGL
jgi:hypothetical protein